MSITKDFENRQRGCMECGGYKEDDVDKLLAHARALETTLKTIVDNYEFDTETCAKEREGVPCQRCQTIIEARQILEGVE
jgi:formamidopyrimidine-DNA glycosylase